MCFCFRIVLLLQNYGTSHTPARTIFIFLNLFLKVAFLRKFSQKYFYFFSGNKKALNLRAF